MGAPLTTSLAGLVRRPGTVEHDLFVGRGYAARFAVETAVRLPGIALPVATPLALVLLKLVAGGIHDRLDILELVRARRLVDGAPWAVDLPAHVAKLSPTAQTVYASLRSDLDAVLT